MPTPCLLLPAGRELSPCQDSSDGVGVPRSTAAQVWGWWVWGGVGLSRGAVGVRDAAGARSSRHVPRSHSHVSSAVSVASAGHGRGRREAGRGRSALASAQSEQDPGQGARVAARLLKSTYIFRRFGNFLKMPVASRTEISLSFSRLHGEQEAGGQLGPGHFFHTQSTTKCPPSFVGSSGNLEPTRRLSQHPSKLPSSFLSTL